MCTPKEKARMRDLIIEMRALEQTDTLRRYNDLKREIDKMKRTFKANGDTFEYHPKNCGMWFESTFSKPSEKLECDLKLLKALSEEIYNKTVTIKPVAPRYYLRGYDNTTGKKVF